MKYKYVFSVIAVLSLSSLFAMEPLTFEGSEPQRLNVLNVQQATIFAAKRDTRILEEAQPDAENLAKSINDYENLKNHLLGLNHTQLGHLLAQIQGDNGELENAFIQSFVCARLLAAVARLEDIQLGDTRKFMANITLMSIFNPNKVMNIFQGYADQLLNSDNEDAKNLGTILSSAINRGLWTVLKHKTNSTDWVLRMHEFYYALTKEGAPTTGDVSLGEGVRLSQGAGGGGAALERVAYETVEAGAIKPAAENKAEAAWRNNKNNKGVAVHLMPVYEVRVVHGSLLAIQKNLLGTDTSANPKLLQAHRILLSLPSNAPENYNVIVRTPEGGAIPETEGNTAREWSRLISGVPVIVNTAKLIATGAAAAARVAGDEDGLGDELSCLGIPAKLVGYKIVNSTTSAGRGGGRGRGRGRGGAVQPATKQTIFHIERNLSRTQLEAIKIKASKSGLFTSRKQIAKLDAISKYNEKTAFLTGSNALTSEGQTLKDIFDILNVPTGK